MRGKAKFYAVTIAMVALAMFYGLNIQDPVERRQNKYPPVVVELSIRELDDRLVTLEETTTLEDASQLNTKIADPIATAELPAPNDRYAAIINQTLAEADDSSNSEKALRIFGSLKAFQLQQLERLDQPVYEGWLSRRFRDGFQNEERVAETTNIMLPVIEDVLSEEGMPEYFECSADLCMTYVAPSQLSQLSNVLGLSNSPNATQPEMPEEFIKVFSGKRQSDGLFLVVFIRQDIDISSYPDSA